ncbi:MAG: polyphosphate polymerase domain-containing protein [Bacteroidetes bacterium]|nr:polyphosphate polymerase domain-containing protein [Bacteroidota bacterium]
MEKILETVSIFEPITLEEMDSVKLMERVDTKYVFSATHLPKILEGMKSDYRLLEINNVRLHRYESLYYDTEKFSLFEKHHKGMLNRYKLRFRRYVDSGGLTFFEIKFKNNKGRTIKNRVKMKAIEAGFTEKAEKFLKEITPFAPELFMPKMWVNYSRMTFVNKFSQERLTIDTGLHFAKADSTDNFSVRFPQMVIAEAKRDKASSISQFIRLVRMTGVRESGISKYCFGVYNLFDIKKNNFKERVRFVTKMANTALAPTGT